MLLEELTGDVVVKRYNKRPKSKIHELENLGQALKFIQANGIKLINVGAADIHNSNETIILGLIWRLIEYYQLGNLIAGKKMNYREAKKQFLGNCKPNIISLSFNYINNDSAFSDLLYSWIY